MELSQESVMTWLHWLYPLTRTISCSSQTATKSCDAQRLGRLGPGRQKPKAMILRVDRFKWERWLCMYELRSIWTLVQQSFRGCFHRDRLVWTCSSLFERSNEVQKLVWKKLIMSQRSVILTIHMLCVQISNKFLRHLFLSMSGLYCRLCRMLVLLRVSKKESPRVHLGLRICSEKICCAQFRYMPEFPAVFLRRSPICFTDSAAYTKWALL